jgi:sulfite reductase (NADPH) flavoprotein alpha-component
LTGFNLILLIPAALAVLLFAFITFAVLRRTHGSGLEPPDPRPAAIENKPAARRPEVAPAEPLLDREAFRSWRLAERLLANPDSAGGPLYRLRFTAIGADTSWRAGAVARVYCGPTADLDDPDTPAGAPVGCYMIGSLPDDGMLELVVRLVPVLAAQGGQRSRWLCETIQPGDEVRIAISDNSDLLPPPAEIPLILIGNATGIAGLHAQIKARPAGSRNWLIFGDRNSADDQVLAAEITQWVSVGHLERCDLVFPGDGEEQRLVTDQIEDARMTVIDWALAGCAIYVCGSRLMGDDVHATLTAILGGDVLDAMAEAGLYRQSVY